MGGGRSDLIEPHNNCLTTLGWPEVGTRTMSSWWGTRQTNVTTRLDTHDWTHALDWPIFTSDSTAATWVVFRRITYQRFVECKTVLWLLQCISNTTISQIPQCISPISYNALSYNRNVHMCTFLLQDGALWDICVMLCEICEMGPIIQFFLEI